jgi:hypothetical protein
MMLITVVTHRAVINKETVHEEKTINSEFYIQVLDGSLQCIWKSHNFNRKAAGSFSTKAPADSATTSETLPGKLWYDKEINPSYSSNFAPANSF